MLKTNTLFFTKLLDWISVSKKILRQVKHPRKQLKMKATENVPFRDGGRGTKIANNSLNFAAITISVPYLESRLNSAKNESERLGLITWYNVGCAHIVP